MDGLFRDAVRFPLVLVCAGAGYGKTSAVHHFAEEYNVTTVWVQLSEHDNVSARFWENFCHSIAQVNEPLAAGMTRVGFPNTREEMNQHIILLRQNIEMKRRIIIMDDFHCITEPSVIRYVEEAMAQSMPFGTSIFLVSRSTPLINIAGYLSKGDIFNINENDLRFTESELAQYFKQLNISLTADTLHEIMQDTEGWVFAINLIAHSYQRAPGYSGYIRNAMKTNIFRFMETEIWDGLSQRLQNFLVSLSLIYHLSVELIALLADGDNELIAEMEKQSAYIHRDSYINSYHIHSLFLEFLATKQKLLSDELKNKTLAIAAEWCNKNGFKIDALSLYERMGNYTAIISLILGLPSQIPYDIAKFTTAILERAPEEAFETVDTLAVTHIRVYICQGLWQKSAEVAEYYEKKFTKLPDSDFKNKTLCSLYYCWAVTRALLCLTDDRYDFDTYFKKFTDSFSVLDNFAKLSAHTPGPWITLVGSSRKGAPEECINALANTVACMSPYFNGRLEGEDYLARAELNFYKGDTHNAELLAIESLERSSKYKQFEIIHRAQFYLMRIAVSHGNCSKAEQALSVIKTYLDETEYPNRHINYDISVSWFYYILGRAEDVSPWIKDNFSAYGHATFIENFGNQIKARYCYMTRDYPPLLSYIRDMKTRESYLFGRLEMLAMEACVYYWMKEKQKAFTALEKAYETALPNELVMPFIELGKDMRTLTGSLLKESGSSIPRPWLENINRKAASYAKRQAHVIVEYRKAAGILDDLKLSRRETEILTDLSHGLSRTQIAANRNLSVNTVKMIINMLYSKAGAENFADLIRIAIERKLI